MTRPDTRRDLTRLSELERLRRDYEFAFLAYRLEPSEQRLQAAYELGRNAMASGLSLLDLATVHHEVVAKTIAAEGREGNTRGVTDAASAFFVEVLSTFEMAQRAFTELRQAAGDKPGPR